MNQRAVDEMLLRTGANGWRFYLWAIPYTAMFIALTWLTFRLGAWYLMAENQGPLYLWMMCMMLLIFMWRSKPRKKKPDQSIRLNLQ